MLEWLQQATGAHWVVAGLVLLIAEVFLPGAFLMWLGFGALLTGVLAWLIPGLIWQAEALIFVVLSIGSILAFRRWRARHPERPTDQPLLNKRVAQLVGRLFDFVEGSNGYDKFIFPLPGAEIVTNNMKEIDEPLRAIFVQRIREIGASKPLLARTTQMTA